MRLNNLGFKTCWTRWIVGFDVVNLSTGIRFFQVYLGPMQFTVCF